MTDNRVVLLLPQDDLTTEVAQGLSQAGFTVEVLAEVAALRNTAPPRVVVLTETGTPPVAGRVRELLDLWSEPVRVLVVCGGGETCNVASILEAGADDFVLLPLRANELVVRITASALRQRALDETERHKRDAAALLELSQTLSSSLQIPLILHSACRLIAQVMGVERCSIVMVDAETQEGVVVAVSENRNTKDLRVSLRKYPEINKVLETGAPLVIEDAEHSDLLSSARESAPGLISGTSIVIPILVEEKVTGVFFLRSRQRRRPPNEREMQFGQTVANATGIAVRNARLFEGARASSERIFKERERTEARLRALQRYEGFFEDAADGMVILDSDATVIYANREGAAALGLTKSEVLGRQLTEFLAADSVQMLEKVLGEVVAGRYRKTFDIYAVVDGGNERCLSCSAGAVGEAGSRDRLCMISFRDVTELREMQTELKATKEFLENLINSSVDAIIAADIKGNVILFNKGAENIYGYRADEVIGRIHVSRLYPTGVAREIMVALRSDAYGGRGKLSSMRKNILTKDHEEVPVNLSASIIYEGGEEVATVGIFSDLRERLKIEQRLSQAQEQLVKSEKAAVVAQLAGTAAHELNQPLTSILGYAEMLKVKIPAESPLRKPVDIIFREGERMADIVRKIGRITKYEIKNYVGNTMIVDLERASDGSRPPAELAESIPPATNKSGNG
ncbi:MAG: PAS domain S-box protein [Myxococcota bacterium]